MINLSVLYGVDFLHSHGASPLFAIADVYSLPVILGYLSVCSMLICRHDLPQARRLDANNGYQVASLL